MARQLPVPERWIRWLAVFVVAAVILWASVTRPTGVRDGLGPLGVVGLDKWFHAAGYAVLATALAYALVERDAIAAAVGALLVAVAFGLGVELLQSPLPYRTFSWWDFLANGVGALVVALGWCAVAPRLGVRRRPVLAKP